MSPFIVPIVGIVSGVVALPMIIVGAVLGSRYLKLRERELAIRERELELDRERIDVIRLVKGRESAEAGGGTEGFGL